MDPITLNQIGKLRQQEILQAAAHDRKHGAKRSGLSQVRNWLNNLAARPIVKDQTEFTDND
jgi:hypothetical protein